MSLQYYPHEDFQIRPGAPPEGLEPHRTDIGPLVIINLTLAMSLVSFATHDEWTGALIVLVVIAAFNLLALSGGRAHRPPRVITEIAEPQAVSSRCASASDQTGVAASPGRTGAAKKRPPGGSAASRSPGAVSSAVRPTGP